MKGLLDSIVERGLQVAAAKLRRPVEDVRERYRLDRSFRRCVDGEANRTLKLEQRKAQTVRYLLEEAAKEMAPPGMANALCRKLRSNYRTDPKTRAMLDQWADATLRGALEMVRTNRVPPPPGPRQ